MHGVILPGQQCFEESRWSEDGLVECHFDDKLWGYAIWVSEELRLRRDGHFSDAVLFNLMEMGVYDWDGKNQQGDQSARALCHSSALAIRLLKRIMEGEKNMSTLLNDWLNLLINLSSSITTL